MTIAVDWDVKPQTKQKTFIVIQALTRMHQSENVEVPGLILQSDNNLSLRCVPFILLIQVGELSVTGQRICTNSNFG